MIMRIDAHQHYWKIDRDDYGWITPEIPILYRDFLPKDLLPALKNHQLDGTIVVQAAATLAETDYLLSLAESDETIIGVVGWLDLNDPDYQAHYERFSRHPKFVGFRVMIQEMPDAAAVLEPQFVEALRYFAERDVPVDLLLVSHQLEPVIALLDQVPGLRGVIDHIAKPRIAEGVMEPWSSQMAAIAKHTNIYCKLSGMATEAAHKSWTLEQYVPYVRHVAEIFGPSRLLFGSDWPVCLLSASYDEVMEIVLNALPDHWTEHDKELLLGLNAKRFYKC
jgi:L-fuconolactonase